MSHLSTCAACGTCFANVALFDLHRIGPFTRRGRRCLPVQHLAARGLFQNEHGVWMLPLAALPTNQEVERPAQVVQLDMHPEGGIHAQL